MLQLVIVLVICVGSYSVGGKGDSWAEPNFCIYMYG